MYPIVIPVFQLI